MNFVQRKATTSLSNYSVSNFAEVKKSFLASVVETVSMEEIPPELILTGRTYLLHHVRWTKGALEELKLEV